MSTDVLTRARAEDLLVLAKPRITFLVTLTTAAGYALAATGPFDFALLARALAGTALVAGGAGALNQVWERELDARMRRTANRPLPAGRVAVETALAWGVSLALAGLALLTWTVNAPTALVGAATLAAYVFLYTPLKRASSLATIVGAFPGAAPPLMGWTAAAGRIDPGGWLLFALLFLWQLPHFLAIAWLYREDYRRAGMPLLTVNDPDGARTGRQAVLWSAALVPVSLAPALLGLAGRPYVLAALALGGAFFAAALAFARAQTPSAARRLLLASVAYLPLVLTALVADHLRLAAGP